MKKPETLYIWESTFKIHFITFFSLSFLLSPLSLSFLSSSSLPHHFLSRTTLNLLLPPPAATILFLSYATCSVTSRTNTRCPLGRAIFLLFPLLSRPKHPHRKLRHLWPSANACNPINVQPPSPALSLCFCMLDPRPVAPFTSFRSFVVFDKNYYFMYEIIINIFINCIFMKYTLI